jgi:hypothetical protein
MKVRFAKSLFLLDLAGDWLEVFVDAPARNRKMLRSVHGILRKAGEGGMLGGMDSGAAEEEIGSAIKSSKIRNSFCSGFYFFRADAAIRCEDEIHLLVVGFTGIDSSN